MDIDSMFSAYLLEKKGCEVFKSEDGFITFSFRNGGAIHIDDIFIPANKRKMRLGSDLVNKFLREVCQENGITMLTASCDFTLKNPELSLSAILGYTSKEENLKFKVLPEDKIVNFYMELPYGR